MAYPIEFLYNGNVVGEFLLRPKCAGRSKYLVYRGIGHFEMQEALRKGMVVECTLTKRKLEEKRKLNFERPTWIFNVISCPEYGVLEISDLREET